MCPLVCPLVALCEIIYFFHVQVLFKYFKIYKAEYKELIAAMESKDDLKPQTPLDSLRKDKLAALAVSCYTDVSLLL